MTNHHAVRLEAQPDPVVSRWLWLVKWLLAIPHYVILAFLWLAFGVLTVVAFFAVLFTGRYPRSIFDFNVGVFRWSWRVGYYAYSALGTDRYPPFTLDDVPDYPARLEVDYPERLSHGLVLVKWLLAVPHILIVAILLGGGPALSYNLNDTNTAIEGGGLLGLLVFFAGVAILFTDRYPRGLYDLIIGLDRWIYRVAAYVFLMTDDYPPFRLDSGPGEDHPTPLPPSTPRTTEAVTPPTPAEPAPIDQPQGPINRTQGSSTQRRWTPGRIVSVVIGTLLIAMGLATLPAGGVALWFDQAGRDSNGYVGTDPRYFSTPGYAISSESGALQLDGPDWFMRRAVGTIRVTGTSTRSAPLFIGLAAERDTAEYLAPIEHAVVTRIDGRWADPRYRFHAGTAPNVPPTDETFWAVSASGTGQQQITWEPRSGNWAVVVMNADGSRAVGADLAVAATLPWLDDVAFWLIGLGLLFLLAGTLLITLAIRRHQRAAPVPVG